MPKKAAKKRRKSTPLRPPDYRRLERVYGITEHEYKTLLKSQKGVCYICHRDPRAFTVRKYRHNLCVDHDHNTGWIRGLLCKNCNTHISRWLNDDHEKVKRVLKYLTRSEPMVGPKRKEYETNE